MEDGLFIWLIIFAVAIVQGIAQRKKKPGKGPGRTPGRTPGREPGMGGGSAPETPRRRPVGTPGEPHTGSLPSGTRPPSSPSQKERERTSSEGMLPADVWEEILGLARGKPPAPRPPTPKPEASPEYEKRSRLELEEYRARPEPAPEEVPPSHRADAVHHKTAVTDVAARLGVTATPAPASAPVEVGGVRGQLFGVGSPEELRKAIILREVLGPPLSMRGD